VETVHKNLAILHYRPIYELSYNELLAAAVVM